MPPRKIARNAHLLQFIQLGDEIDVWWPHDNTYYPGRVTGVLPGDRHRVDYTDGEVEELKLATEQWRFRGDAARRVQALLANRASTADTSRQQSEPPPSPPLPSQPPTLRPSSKKGKARSSRDSGPAAAPATAPASSTSSSRRRSRSVNISESPTERPPKNASLSLTDERKHKLAENETHHTKLTSYSVPKPSLNGNMTEPLSDLGQNVFPDDDRHQTINLSSDDPAYQNENLVKSIRENVRARTSLESTGNNRNGSFEKHNETSVAEGNNNSAPNEDLDDKASVDSRTRSKDKPPNTNHAMVLNTTRTKRRQSTSSRRRSSLNRIPGDDIGSENNSSKVRQSKTVSESTDHDSRSNHSSKRTGQDREPPLDRTEKQEGSVAPQGRFVQSHQGFHDGPKQTEDTLQKLGGAESGTPHNAMKKSSAPISLTCLPTATKSDLSAKSSLAHANSEKSSAPPQPSAQMDLLHMAPPPRKKSLPSQTLSRKVRQSDSAVAASSSVHHSNSTPGPEVNDSSADVGSKLGLLPGDFLNDGVSETILNTKVDRFAKEKASDGSHQGYVGAHQALSDAPGAPASRLASTLGSATANKASSATAVPIRKEASEICKTLSESGSQRPTGSVPAPYPFRNEFSISPTEKGSTTKFTFQPVSHDYRPEAIRASELTEKQTNPLSSTGVVSKEHDLEVSQQENNGSQKAMRLKRQGAQDRTVQLPADIGEGSDIKAATDVKKQSNEEALQVSGALDSHDAGNRLPGTTMAISSLLVESHAPQEGSHLSESAEKSQSHPCFNSVDTNVSKAQHLSTTNPKHLSNAVARSNPSKILDVHEQPSNTESIPQTTRRVSMSGRSRPVLAFPPAPRVPYLMDIRDVQNPDLDLALLNSSGMFQRTGKPSTHSALSPPLSAGSQSHSGTKVCTESRGPQPKSVPMKQKLGSCNDQITECPETNEMPDAETDQGVGGMEPSRQTAMRPPRASKGPAFDKANLHLKNAVSSGKLRVLPSKGFHEAIGSGHTDDTRGRGLQSAEFSLASKGESALSSARRNGTSSSQIPDHSNAAEGFVKGSNLQNSSELSHPVLPSRTGRTVHDLRSARLPQSIERSGAMEELEGHINAKASPGDLDKVTVMGNDHRDRQISADDIPLVIGSKIRLIPNLTHETEVEPHGDSPGEFSNGSLKDPSVRDKGSSDPRTMSAAIHASGAPNIERSVKLSQKASSNLTTMTAEDASKFINRVSDSNRVKSIDTNEGSAPRNSVSLPKVPVGPVSVDDDQKKQGTTDPASFYSSPRRANTAGIRKDIILPSQARSSEGPPLSYGISPGEITRLNVGKSGVFDQLEVIRPGKRRFSTSAAIVKRRRIDEGHDGSSLPEMARILNSTIGNSGPRVTGPLKPRDYGFAHPHPQSSSGIGRGEMNGNGGGLTVAEGVASSKRPRAQALGSAPAGPRSSAGVPAVLRENFVRRVARNPDLSSQQPRNSQGTNAAPGAPSGGKVSGSMLRGRSSSLVTQNVEKGTASLPLDILTRTITESNKYVFQSKVGPLTARIEDLFAINAQQLNRVLAKQEGLDRTLTSLSRTLSKTCEDVQDLKGQIDKSRNEINLMKETVLQKIGEHPVNANSVVQRMDSVETTAQALRAFVARRLDKISDEVVESRMATTTFVKQFVTDEMSRIHGCLNVSVTKQLQSLFQDCVEKIHRDSAATLTNALQTTLAQMADHTSDNDGRVPLLQGADIENIAENTNFDHVADEGVGDGVVERGGRSEDAGEGGGQGGGQGVSESGGVGVGEGGSEGMGEGEVAGGGEGSTTASSPN